MLETQAQINQNLLRQRGTRMFAIVVPLSLYSFLHYISLDYHATDSYRFSNSLTS